MPGKRYKIKLRTPEEAQITEEYNRLKDAGLIPYEESLETKDAYREERLRHVDKLIAKDRGVIESVGSLTEDHDSEFFRNERLRMIGEKKARELGFL
jgi:hypothetical protein